MTLIFFIGSLEMGAQFNTISMPNPLLVVDTSFKSFQEQSTDSIPDYASEASQPDTPILPDSKLSKFTPEQLRTLYLQLEYLDNEMYDYMYDFFKRQIEREASRLKALQVNTMNESYSFEENCVTSVNGNYVATSELSIESVLAEILKNNLAHPRIVLAQAVLETGWFKSSVCRNYNNLFGLTNPRTKDYYRFNTWQESVRAYYTKVQYRYKSGNYLRWLREIGYAEDPDYTVKLRVLLDGPLMKYSAK